MRHALATLLAAALLCPVALARRDAEQAEQPPQEVDPAKDPCPTVPPRDWVLEVGHAEGTRAEALQAARSQARASLIERATAGYDDLQRDAVIRHIYTWGEGLYTEPARRGEPGTACAAVAVKQEYLDLIQARYKQFSTDLDGLAASIRAGVDTRPFAMQPPRWSSGCPSSELGQALAAKIKQHLAGIEIRPSQVAAFGESATAGSYLELWLELAPGPTGVALNAHLREAGAEGYRLLGGFDFPLSLFNIDPEERGDCHDETILGLQRGRLVGADGLVVEVAYPSLDGVICEGQQVEMSLDTNMPAKVWLFSVAADGLAWLSWPVGEGSGQVAGHLSLGAGNAARMPTGGDERLVAVAVPRGATWGAVQGWQGNCRVPVKLEDLTWPPGAAIGSEVFAIAPAGQGDCPPAQVYSPEELRAYLEGLKVCGE